MGNKLPFACAATVVLANVALHLFYPCALVAILLNAVLTVAWIVLLLLIPFEYIFVFPLVDIVSGLLLKQIGTEEALIRALVWIILLTFGYFAVRSTEWVANGSDKMMDWISKITKR